MAKRKFKSSRKKKSKAALKNPQTLKKVEPEELKYAPHSFVFHRGQVGSNILELTKDFRKVMEPYTASSLKARKANTLKDFIAVAGVLHVTHTCIFSSAVTGNVLKIARVPRGPTLYFKILNYSLTRDVISSLKKQVVMEEQFQHAPLVILNNFGGDSVHFKLLSSMLQNMFPSINLARVNLNNIRRCVLFNYNLETNEIEFRHFAIRIRPVGISKGVKKIVSSVVPNMARFDDISEFISKGNLLSESEAEDDPSSHVTLPQKIASRGNMESAKSAIRLVELGPRMTLQLIKIENNFMSGEVLYHTHITKTHEEKVATEKRIESKKKMKEKIQKEQEKNKQKKQEEREKLKVKSLKGMKNIEASKVEEDDDVVWFRDEVGHEPEADLFDKKKKVDKKRKTPFNGPMQRKKLKKSKNAEAT